MRTILKNIGKNSVIIFILTFLIIILYLFVHEAFHYSVCESIGLNGEVTINLLINPPVYSVNCEGINEKSNLSKFLFWGSPYIVSLVIMISFLIYLNKKKFYFVSLPLSVIISDSLNFFGLYEFSYKKGNLGNDLFNLLVKTPNEYYYLMLIIFGLTVYLFILNLIHFYIEFVKTQNLKTYKTLKEHENHRKRS